jgi:hypothetical protein
MWRDIRSGKRIAIGPNVAFCNSQYPGQGDGERELLAYQNYAAVMTLSRWYSALQQKWFAQKSNHYILDYPLPQLWVGAWTPTTPSVDAFIFIKGGAEERRIGYELKRRFTNSITLEYGSYSREQLFDAARRSRVCFYVSREDHYPMAAVEITLTNCPIISDERACPAFKHGITGIVAAVRERGESDPFVWAKDAAERLAVEYAGACKLDRGMVRASTITAHDPALMRERVAAQLGLG